ncbi:MAG: hypothetical protein JW395_1091 [Nitrospira sp.]|nr:hypothetical protein [Nitrospira sp.]
MNVTNPNTNTTPPSVPSNKPTEGPTDRACAGSNGNTGWLTLLPVIVTQELTHSRVGMILATRPKTLT